MRHFAIADHGASKCGDMKLFNDKLVVYLHVSRGSQYKTYVDSNVRLGGTRGSITWHPTIHEEDFPFPTLQEKAADCCTNKSKIIYFEQRVISAIYQHALRGHFVNATKLRHATSASCMY